MKPSEEIRAIFRNLVDEDWVKFGGNSYSQASWNTMHQFPEENYIVRAILKFLDNKSK